MQVFFCYVFPLWICVNITNVIETNAIEGEGGEKRVEK